MKLRKICLAAILLLAFSGESASAGSISGSTTWNIPSQIKNIYVEVIGGSGGGGGYDATYQAGWYSVQGYAYGTLTLDTSTSMTLYPGGAGGNGTNGGNNNNSGAGSAGTTSLSGYGGGAGGNAGNTGTSGGGGGGGAASVISLSSTTKIIGAGGGGNGGGNSSCYNSVQAASMAQTGGNGSSSGGSGTQPAGDGGGGGGGGGGSTGGTGGSSLSGTCTSEYTGRAGNAGINSDGGFGLTTSYLVADQYASKCSSTPACTNNGAMPAGSITVYYAETGTVSINPAPTASVTATGNLNITASGTAPTSLSYQWQQSTDSGTTWSDISGATSTTLSLSNIQRSTNGYQYRLAVINTITINKASWAGGGTTTLSTRVFSNPETVTVNAASPSVSLSVGTIRKLQNTTITATLGTPATVTFYANNRPINRCTSVTTATTTATCTWKPLTTGVTYLSARLVPTDSSNYSTVNSGNQNSQTLNRNVNR